MTATVAAGRADQRTLFYHWMALTCLLLAVIGFMPTFFIPVAQGTFPRPPMTYLHALLMFSWTIYFCFQTWLAANGRTSAHREWGLLGVALATAIAFSVMTVAAVRLHENPPRPPGLVMLDVSSLAYFEACVVAALANVRRPEVHKRFMLLATISTMGAHRAAIRDTPRAAGVCSRPLGPSDARDDSSPSRARPAGLASHRQRNGFRLANQATCIADLCPRAADPPGDDTGAVLRFGNAGVVGGGSLAAWFRRLITEAVHRCEGRRSSRP